MQFLPGSGPVLINKLLTVLHPTHPLQNHYLSLSRPVGGGGDVGTCALQHKESDEELIEHGRKDVPHPSTEAACSCALHRILCIIMLLERKKNDLAETSDKLCIDVY